MNYGAAGDANVVNSVSRTYHSGGDPFKMASPMSRGLIFLQGTRSRLNAVGVLVALFAPWLLFCAVAALLSFWLHYRTPNVCYTIVGAAFLLGVAFPGGLAARQLKLKSMDPSYTPSWYIFLTITCLIAFVLAVWGGNYNYQHYMQPYYDYGNLAVYDNLDTNQFVGQQLMDAGRIDFKEGTVLDLKHSMGFRNTDLFCVVPIVTRGSAYPALSHDFWAVGKNCCSGNQADFHCKGFAEPHSKGALRLRAPWDRPFYRLAVQQAEATYKITANHPLFFEWVMDAEQEMYNFAKNGYVNYLIGICSFFLLQGFLTTAAVVALTKLVHQ